MIDIPKKWTKHLHKMLDIYPKIVLAGGALRDLDHDIPVKDLDFFIGCGSDSEAVSLNEKLGGKKLNENWSDNCWYPDSMREIILVNEQKSKLDGIPCQLIFVNWNVTHIVQRFDYGLCRISYNGKDVNISEDYKKDKDAKRFRLIRADNPNALEVSVELSGS